MNNAKAKEETSTTQSNQASPLTQLADALDADMKEVNAEIIKRMDSPVALIPQLASYLIAAGGKRIRPLMTLASTQIYGGDMTKAYGLATSVEFIHSATLLHDDVVDQSPTRRGKETANEVFGNQASVLVGDFLFSRAFQLMTDSNNIEILRILSDASAVIAQGEVMQLAAINNIDTTLEDYIQILKAKTAALFAAACEIGPVLAGADPSAARAMAEYGMNLGIAFQIADDALDYAGDQEALGKTIGDDFREGKMTAPIFMALQNASDEESAFWSRTIKDHEQTDADLATAQDIIAKHDAVQASLDLAHKYGKKARLALAEAPDHPLRALLDELVEYTIERRS